MMRLRYTRRRILDRVDRFVTVVGVDARISGRLIGRRHSLVHGTFVGDCDLAATLLIGPGSEWDGNIAAESVVIAGSVTGNIAALRKVELGETAQVVGDITAPEVAIAAGAVHVGGVHVVGNAEPTAFQERRRRRRPPGATARRDDSHGATVEEA